MLSSLRRAFPAITQVRLHSTSLTESIFKAADNAFSGAQRENAKAALSDLLPALSLYTPPEKSEPLTSFVNGQSLGFHEGAPVRSLPIPHSDHIEAKYAEATAAEVDECVERAKEAQAQWANVSGAERGRLLFRVSQRLRQLNDALSILECIDTGRPIAETVCVDIVSAADCLEYFAGLAPRISGQHFDMGGSNFAYTRREPLGVCAGIGAWNYPLQGAAWKAAPALACGNALIFKPAELTPLTALAMAFVMHEVGIPPGVFNVVLGGKQVGEQLSTHNDIAKVSFTGSASTGKAVMRDASSTLKAVTMELGGKSPLLIFEDANLNNAVAGALMANFYSNGEVCSNGTRVLVQQSILEPFLDQLYRRMDAMKGGDPTHMSTDYSSLVSSEHKTTVMNYIRKGLEEKAKLYVSGVGYTANANDADGGGNIVRPCVFTDCHDGMTIVKEEIFGPVMAVMPFTSEDEAIARANNTTYGLSAGVFTKDLDRAHRVIKQFQAGTTWINDYNLAPVELPWGGYKQSGLGRENGGNAVEFWTQLKSVYVQTGDVACPY